MSSIQALWLLSDSRGLSSHLTVIGNFQYLSVLRIRVVVGKRSALPAEGAGCIGFYVCCFFLSFFT